MAYCDWGAPALWESFKNSLCKRKHMVFSLCFLLFILYFRIYHIFLKWKLCDWFSLIDHRIAFGVSGLKHCKVYQLIACGLLPENVPEACINGPIKHGLSYLHVIFPFHVNKAASRVCHRQSGISTLCLFKSLIDFIHFLSNPEHSHYEVVFFMFINALL